jgi:DNA polymerase-3 subunit gamma/tau
VVSTSHLVLARKWRPDRFSDLVGQEHVTRTLEQALRSGRIAHAFLFTGIRGVGKTTAARILARCLNCVKGPTAEPCGECPPCLEIRSGSALDVVEIDGATYRKIDDARAIIENLGYRPARDRFKVYIIDEAHQLTDQAFNALLKTLEEPPAHVKFILATTEPQKMPETILSRLQRYDFRRIPSAVIRNRLHELAEREGVEVEDSALTLLAREAGGSMRDGERMLETAIASLGAKVRESELAAILGVASRSRIFEIVGAILRKDPAAALRTARELNQHGANLESLGRDLLETFRNLAVAKLPGDGPKHLLADLPDQESAELQSLARQASTRDLMRLFRLMADAQEQLARSAFPDLILEMAMIRMATIAPVLDTDELLRAISGGGDGGDGSDGDGTSRRPSSAARTPDTNAGSKRKLRSAEPFSKSFGGMHETTPFETSSGPEALSAPRRRIPFEGEVKAYAPRSVRAAAVGSVERAVDGSQELPELRDFIRNRRAALAGFMEQGASLKIDGDLLIVIPRSDIYVRYLTDNRAVISELASELYGRRIRVEISDGAASTSSSPALEPLMGSDRELQVTAGPAAFSSQESKPPLARENGSAREVSSVPASHSQSDARQRLYADPVVRGIFEQFDARLVELKTGVRPDATAASADKK